MGTRDTGHRWLPAIALALVVVLAGACTQDVRGIPRTTPGGTIEVPGEFALARADGCDQLAASVQERMAAQQAWETEDSRTAPHGGVMSADGAPVTTAAPAAATASKAAGVDATGRVVAGTNTQEAGVDEADLVKTDGARLVTVVDGVLRVVGLDGTPAVDGTLDLRTAGARQLFLRGDEAVVLGSSVPVAVEDSTKPMSALPSSTVQPFAGAPSTSITRVDLTGQKGPSVIESTTVEGDLVAARASDGAIRLVLRSWPMPMAMPDAATTDDVLPGTGLPGTGLSGTDLLPRRTTSSGTVVPLGTCRDVLTSTMTSTASEPTAEVTVLTIRDSLSDLEPVTVAGGVDTVYASTGALYLASTAWDGSGPVTAVHRLDLGGRGGATYTGSGLVPGSLLDQYSLSERDGALRLVTTTQGMTSSGRLAVLRPDRTGTLREVGHVDDLGVGESVQSVRFLDDRAYVVTFRRTDPLFAIDLSDPTAPRVLGELKIPGFSEYLHPVGQGRLLGVGRDVDPATGTDRGLKISLFDVSDPTAPRELSTILRPGEWSPVSDDALAFTWDPVRGQAVVPLSGRGAVSVVPECGPGADCGIIEPVPLPPGPVDQPGALVVGMAGDGLVVRGELSHPGPVAGSSAAIVRSVVVDDDLWTVSAIGVGRTPATAPTTVDLVRF